MIFNNIIIIIMIFVIIIKLTQYLKKNCVRLSVPLEIACQTCVVSRLLPQNFLQHDHDYDDDDNDDDDMNDDDDDDDENDDGDNIVVMVV